MAPLSCSRCPASPWATRTRSPARTCSVVGDRLAHVPVRDEALSLAGPDGLRVEPLDRRPLWPGRGLTRPSADDYNPARVSILTGPSIVAVRWRRCGLVEPHEGPAARTAGGLAELDPRPAIGDAHGRDLAGIARTRARTALRLMFSDSIAIGIRKDLTTGPVAAESEPYPPIRQGSLADVLALVDQGGGDVADANDRWQRRSRRRAVDKIGVEGCFVADIDGHRPAFMQYLFTADDNDRIQAAFPGMLPVLAPDEAMVEFLYVTPEARNPGVAISCVAQVLDVARKRGVSSVIAYVGPSNKGAVFVSQSTGFRAYAIRRSKTRLLRKTYTFEPWPSEVSNRLLDVVTGRAKIA